MTRKIKIHSYIRFFFEIAYAMHVIVSVLCLVLIKQHSARSVKDDRNLFDHGYKARLLSEEANQYLGGSLTLSEDEERANRILMHWKDKETDKSFNNPQYFNFSKHYFTYKNDIEKSTVYQIIRRMPKGAALHIHSSLMLHSDDMIELTYEDHLYACYAEDKLDLQFSDSVPRRPCSVKWTLLSDLRNASDKVELFDAGLKKFFTLYTEDEKILNSDINFTWSRFDKVYRVIKSLVSYRPVREKFFYKALKRFYDDNILYIEIRSGLHSLYELDGSTHDKMYLAKLYERIANKFMEEYPDFVGIKFILTHKRSGDIEKVRETLEFARILKGHMPDMFAGFDLVGQEDLGKPLADFVPVLSEAKYEIDYYFHGGETNWLGTPSDENLFDAIVLGSKRIGHAYALVKHPSLLSAARENNIAIEVNVISNVILSLVRDVRNHPLATYLAIGLPVVLSSDDPGAWDSDPLSHDFYVAFVGVASKHADLRMLKKLATNSIRYSALNDKGKRVLFQIFYRRWNKFIQDLIALN